MIRCFLLRKADRARVVHSGEEKDMGRLHSGFPELKRSL